ncbi:MAG: hypothetical protein M0R06_17660 [Sphaerochaeta sp.]|jgi:hypothetical protein|nr:hypothetical protein [Sphaerochaeta sp.]
MKKKEAASYKKHLKFRDDMLQMFQDDVGAAVDLLNDGAPASAKDVLLTALLKCLARIRQFAASEGRPIRVRKAARYPRRRA